MDVEQFSLSLSSPLETATGAIDRREGFLVRQDRDGTVGIGEATPLPGWTESLAECRDALERAADGEDIDPSVRPSAAHALDLAAADARARAADRPLYRELGGNERATVPVNATVGDGSPSETGEAAEAAVDDGFETVKVKVGARSVAADVERLRSVRTEIGADVALRADANGAWTPAEAQRAFESFEDLQVDYVEQPLPAENLAEHRDLDGDVGVAFDEGVVEHGPDAVLAADVADVVVLKPMALGGVERARRVAMRARERGVTPVVTTTVDGVVARTAAVHLAASLPAVPACGLATADRLASDLGPDPAPVDDGEIHVPQGAGLGIEPEAVHP